MNKQELIKKVKVLEENNSAFTRDYEIGYTECMDKVLLLIEQLDEPQKISWRKAISVLEHHFQCEIPINLDNVVKGYREMSGILNTVEFELSKRNSELTAKEFIFEALESKKHKVKVPAYVAEWIERNKSGDVQLIIILKYFGKWVEMNENETLDDEICKWVIENSETFMRAWLDGYEVEEEPKYYIQLPGTTWGTYLVKSDDNDLLVWQNTRDGTPFTEQEIKSIDERYWPFAVPVEKV